jgi:hypothetical protein
MVYERGDEDLLELVRDHAGYREKSGEDLLELVRYDAGVVYRDSLKWGRRDLTHLLPGNMCGPDWRKNPPSLKFLSFYCRLRFDPYKRGIKLAMVFLASKSLLS